jgi:hypothetical protein
MAELGFYGGQARHVIIVYPKINKKEAEEYFFFYFCNLWPAYRVSFFRMADLFLRKHTFFTGP